MADPGFPRGGATTPQVGGGGVATHDFAKFSQNLHEIKIIWVIDQIKSTQFLHLNCIDPQRLVPYPEIDDSRFRCALWIFKQQLTLKIRVRCGISIVRL